MLIKSQRLNLADKATLWLVGVLAMAMSGCETLSTVLSDPAIWATVVISDGDDDQDYDHDYSYDDDCDEGYGYGDGYGEQDYEYLDETMVDVSPMPAAVYGDNTDDYDLHQGHAGPIINDDPNQWRTKSGTAHGTWGPTLKTSVIAVDGKVLYIP